MWLQQFFKNLCRRRRLNGFRAAKGISRIGLAVFRGVVRTNALHHFKKQAAARKTDTLAIHDGPFIQTTHAFRTELAAEPVDVIHEHDLLHAKARGLHRSSTGGLIAADDEQICLNDFSRQQ